MINKFGKTYAHVGEYSKLEFGFSIRELANITNKCYETVQAQMRNGYCHYPEKKDRGYVHHPSFSCWDGMIQRCNNKKSRAYPDYGGRGINVCIRWRHFPNFAEDMGAKPGPEFSLGRIDNNKGYEPGNVRWETMAQQAINKRPIKKKTSHGIEQHGRKFRFCYRGARLLFDSMEDAIKTKESLYGVQIERD